MAGHGTFTWNELLTRDIEGAKRFYAATLGWRFDAWAMADGRTYWIAKAGDDTVAGLTDMNDEALADLAPRWFAYVKVDDVDARAAAAVAHGGTLVRDPYDIPEVGRIAVVQDATGAAVGLLTPVPRS